MTYLSQVLRAMNFSGMGANDVYFISISDMLVKSQFANQLHVKSDFFYEGAVHHSELHSFSGINLEKNYFCNPFGDNSKK